MDDPDLHGLTIGPRATADPDLVAAVAARFGLGAVLDVRDLGGTYNLNVRLRTAAGDYVVRVYRPWVTADRLALLHRVKHDLARSGFPVPTPVPAPDGETVGRFGDRLLEVERYVGHDGVADGWARYETAFAVLGRLHDALAARFAGRPFVEPLVSSYATPDLLARWTPKTAEHIDRGQRSPDAERAAETCARAAAMLPALRAWWDDTGDRLPKQATHGDYGGGNLLFRGDRLRAILDFDFLGTRERVFDLAYGLFWMLERLEGDRPPAAHSWARLRDMLARYDAATARPLTPAEVAAIPIEMARVPLYWVAEAWLLPDPVAGVLARAPGVDRALWLHRRRDEIAALLRG